MRATFIFPSSVARAFRIDKVIDATIATAAITGAIITIDLEKIRWKIAAVCICHV